jgi:hypothetical protein
MAPCLQRQHGRLTVIPWYAFLMTTKALLFG